MEFWGLEVPSGKGKEIIPQNLDHNYIHVSQVALGKNAKENERYVLQISTGAVKNLVLGTLVKNRCDQIHLDLVFADTFELSHTGSGSVYFAGYGTKYAIEDYSDETDEEAGDEDEEEDDEEEETVAAALPGPVQATASAKKGKGKEVEQKEVKASKAQGKTPNVDEEMGGEDDDNENKGGVKETLSALATARKRVSEAMKEDPASQPLPAKKAKADKTGTPTPVLPPVPYPAPASTSTPSTSGKKATTATTAAAPEATAKTPKAETKPPTPKAGAAPASGKKLSGFSCTPCAKSFQNETALAQHTKSKHGAS